MNVGIIKAARAYNMHSGISLGVYLDIYIFGIDEVDPFATDEDYKCMYYISIYEIY